MNKQTTQTIGNALGAWIDRIPEWFCDACSILAIVVGLLAIAVSVATAVIPMGGVMTTPTMGRPMAERYEWTEWTGAQLRAGHAPPLPGVAILRDGSWERLSRDEAAPFLLGELLRVVAELAAERQTTEKWRLEAEGLARLEDQSLRDAEKWKALAGRLHETLAAYWTESVTAEDEESVESLLADADGVQAAEEWARLKDGRDSWKTASLTLEAQLAEARAEIERLRIVKQESMESEAAVIRQRDALRSETAPTQRLGEIRAAGSGRTRAV